MSATLLENTDLDWQALEDTFEPPRCESRNHEAGCASGMHGGWAEWFQHGQCEHATGYRCGGWVALIRRMNAYDIHMCGRCGKTCAVEDLRFSPIGATS